MKNIIKTPLTWVAGVRITWHLSSTRSFELDGEGVAFDVGRLCVAVWWWKSRKNRALAKAWGA